MGKLGFIVTSLIASIAFAAGNFSAAESASACENLIFFGLLFVSPLAAGVTSSAWISESRKAPSFSMSC